MLNPFSHVQLCHPMDGSLPGSSVHGILQARMLEWAAMPSSSDLPNPRSNLHLLCLLHWQAGSLPLVTWEALSIHTLYIKTCLYRYNMYIYTDTRYVTVYVLISTCTFISPPASTFPLVGLNLFPKSEIQFLFGKLVHLYPLFCFTSMPYHRIFAFLSLI